MKNLPEDCRGALPVFHIQHPYVSPFFLHGALVAMPGFYL